LRDEGALDGSIARYSFAVMISKPIV